MDSSADKDFAAFVDDAGPRLRQAFLAAYGPDGGAAATATALAHARRRWEQVRSAPSPLRNLYRSASHKSRWYRRRPLNLPPIPEAAAPWIESGLPGALRELDGRQRVGLMLRHGYGWAPLDVADLLGTDVGSLQRDVDQAMAQLRTTDGPPVRDAAEQLRAYAEVLDQSAPETADLIGAGGRLPQRLNPKIAAALGVVAVAVVLATITVATQAPSATTIPTAGAADNAAIALPPISVRLVSPQAITTSMFSEWPHSFAGPGAMAVVDGTYHMLSAAYGDGANTVAYATSTDGVVWSQASDEPILDLAEAPWLPLSIDHALPRSLVVDGNGGFQLFFEVTWFDPGSNESRAAIGRVVARDPLAGWIYDPQPVLTRDSARPWMSQGVVSPSVVRDKGGWLVMLFVGLGDGGGSVGLAQSVGGHDWESRPGPVLRATGEWEDGEITRVDLIALRDGFAAFYSGASTDRRGLAVSAEALEWVPHPQNPLLRAGDVPRVSLFDSEFVDLGGNVLAYLENGEILQGSDTSIVRIEVDLEQVVNQLAGD